MDDDDILLCEGIVVDTIDEEAVKSFRLDEAARGEDPVANYIDETVSFFFGCPPSHHVSDLVARGTPYIGGGSQFAALMRFWMQDNLRNGPDRLTSFGDILAEKNLENNLQLLDAIQLFLLTCCLRDRDVSRIEQMKNEESQEQFGQSVLRAQKFILSGFTALSSPVDITATKRSTWVDVLRFISY